MSGTGTLRRLALITGTAALFLLMLATEAALAATDGSNSYLMGPWRDNATAGYSSSYPHHCWQGLDMIYYAGEVWEAYYKGGVGTKDEGDKVAVIISRQPVGADKTPISEPTHYTVPDSDLWTDGDLTKRRHSVVRLAVFKNRLFLYSARLYDDSTDMTLWEKELSDSTFDGSKWQVEGQDLWSERGTSSSPKVLQGMVVKVMNDTIYILAQQAGSKDLYLMTSTDATTYTREKIHTFTNNDCILNGDVVATAKGSPRIAFVTKDDVTGGSNSTGLCKLWTFDPTTKIVSAVATVPNKYKDMAIVAGDIKGCTDYGANNLQIWAVGWGSENVYHLQYRFNDTATGGTFDPTGILDCGNTSPHMEQKYRGYLAACAAPEQVSETVGEETRTHLQMTARVWWWGSTDTGAAHGRSIKYLGDYLKNLGPQEVATPTDEIDPSWILQGVVMGIPPYYSNGTGTGHLGDIEFSYGIKDETMVDSTVKSSKAFSMSYKKEGILDAVSIGFSYSNALEETASTVATTTISQTLAFGPNYLPDVGPNDPGIEKGESAWGVFLAPTITSDKYELYAPDQTTDLGVALYYTYISAEGTATLVTKVFDMTRHDNTAMTAEERAYWAGVKLYPNSMEYYDPRWSDEYTAIADSVPGQYVRVLSKNIDVDGNKNTFEITNSSKVLETESATNTIGVEASVVGLETGMTGEWTFTSSTATTFAQQVRCTYGIIGWDYVTPEPADYGYYLTEMHMTMNLLEATSGDAFWIPDGARDRAYPWCVAWHVNKYENIFIIRARQVTGEVLAATPSDVGVGLSAALVAKLKAAQAAYDRGDFAAVRGIIASLINQIEAKSGKGIPADTAARWISLLEIFMGVRL